MKCTLVKYTLRKTLGAWEHEELTCEMTPDPQLAETGTELMMAAITVCHQCATSKNPPQAQKNIVQNQPSPQLVGGSIGGTTGGVATPHVSHVSQQSYGDKTPTTIPVPKEYWNLKKAGNMPAAHQCLAAAFPAYAGQKLGVTKDSNDKYVIGILGGTPSPTPRGATGGVTTPHAPQQIFGDDDVPF